MSLQQFICRADHHISYKCWEPVISKCDTSTWEDLLVPGEVRTGDVPAPVLGWEENLLFHELEQCSCEEGEPGGKGTKRLWDIQPSWNSSRLFSKGLCGGKWSTA